MEIDEHIVKACVQATLQVAAAVDPVLASMLRLPEAQAVYDDGSCIGNSRGRPRWLCPATAELRLPAV